MSSPGTNRTNSNVPIIAWGERLGRYGTAVNTVDELDIEFTHGRSEYQPVTTICAFRQANN